MINKIYTIEQLKRKIEISDLAIWANDWIGELLKQYVYCELNMQIQIHAVDEYYFAKHILLVGHEMEMDKIARNVCNQPGVESITVFSDELKDALDEFMMTKYPIPYEGKILFSRKEEMDLTKTEEFKKKIWELLENESFPIFESIEIETINRCNGTCSFCPINRNDDVRVLEKMSSKLFYSIIDQLAAIQYRGRIALFSNNEPFIDDRICEFARYTAEKLPNACKIIFTNGTLVKEATFRQIIKYVDVFNFDIYYDNSINEELPNEVRKILNECKSNEEIKRKVMIQTINRSAIRNNRGGQSKNRNRIYKVKAPCMLPFIQMIVRPSGKTSLCCNDALGKYTLADLNKENLVEAWNNQNYMLIRQSIEDTRQTVEMCRLCDNFASTNTLGNDFFTDKQIQDAWKRIEKIVGGMK